MLKPGAVHRIAVTEVIARGVVPWKGFHDLLCRPFRSRIAI
jgi:hypothetical protein